MTPENDVYPERLARCDNCDEWITEADDYLTDAVGMIHTRCNPSGSDES